jgi:hypothetical protein
MPTPTTSVLPKPKSWDEFEDIVWDIYKRKWQDPYAQRYGRSGQRQNGVDIYGQQIGFESYIAVQCKRYEDGKLNRKGIEAEISEVEKFSSTISEYIIATTASRDTKIQDCIRCLNEQRQPEGKFSVHVVFWDDLCDELTNPVNRDLLKKHYSEWGEIFKASDLDIDWYQISRKRLEEQQKLTTNFLTKRQGITHHLEPVYVPLGLEEHREPPKRQGDVAPEEGSKLYREAKTTQTFEHQQFLDQVLRPKQSPESQGRQIAIVGQPGAGKTTRLQQIAQWVTQDLKQAVIWVSLSALEGKTLEAYLLKEWLKNTRGVPNVSLEQENAFVEWFKDSQTWLLLDGVDEMSAGTHASPLAAIASQVTGWIGQASIILTCRQNLWDTNAHGKELFDAYRTLDFAYPTQVEQFIENWFAQEEATRGQRLCVALRERGRERIQDLVKNPLLLTLLCLDWHIREGNLPETRAALYEHFTEDFYEWKKTEIPTTFQQREQLNAKLSELALEAIEKEANRFCLRQEFISQFMGEPEDETSLFCLALKLGWLNQVGVDASNPRKSIYAFLHPTFEEYFAALAAKKLTFEQLRGEVFGRHWQDKAWHEVLQLICGMVDAESAGKLIEFLMEQELEHDDDFSCREEYEYHEQYCANHALNKLLIAADCFGEVEQPEVIDLISSRLLSELKKFYEDRPRLRLVVEFTSNEQDGFSLNLIRISDEICNRIAKYFQNEPDTLSWLKEQFKAIRYADWSEGLPLIWAVTHYFHDDVQTLPWLANDVYPSSDSGLSPLVLDEIGQSFRDNPQALVLLKTLVERGASDAVSVIAKYYVDEPTTLPLLIHYAQQTRDLNVQQSALIAIVRHYGNDLEILEWVQQFILEKCECSVQEEVVKEIVEHYGDRPDIVVWLQQRFFPQAQESRWNILNSFLVHDPIPPQAFELLQDWAANAADIDTREWATEELKSWEKESLLAERLGIGDPKI